MKPRLIAACVAAVAFSVPAFSADTMPKDTMPKDTTSRDTTPNTMSRDAAAPKKEHGVMNDAMITTKVKAELAKDKMVSATKIHVDTDNGVVTLAGTAKSKAEADKAVTLAKSVSGVETVKNDIKVQPNDTMSKDTMPRDRTARNTDTATPKKEHGVMSDAMITTKIKAEFAKDKTVSATKIHVDTDNGIVTLGGTAKSKAEVDHAVTLAKNVSGVESVKNDIRVQTN